MKYAGKVFSTMTVGVLFAPSFMPQSENNTVVYIPVTYDKIVDHRFVATNTPTVVEVSIPNGYPVDPSALQKSIHKSSGFGMRVHPIWKSTKMHTGLDMGAKIGTPIVSTGDGQVIRIQRRGTGYGWNIVIQHTDLKYRTLYAHMSRIDVEIGQKINKGDVIGAVGNTGASSGPHLHYEVMVLETTNGNAGRYKKVDPVPFIEKGKQTISLKEVI